MYRAEASEMWRCHWVSSARCFGASWRLRLHSKLVTEESYSFTVWTFKMKEPWFFRSSGTQGHFPEVLSPWHTLHDHSFSLFGWLRIFVRRLSPSAAPAIRFSYLAESNFKKRPNCFFFYNDFQYWILFVRCQVKLGHCECNVPEVWLHVVGKMPIIFWRNCVIRLQGSVSTLKMVAPNFC